MPEEIKLGIGELEFDPARSPDQGGVSISQRTGTLFNDVSPATTDAELVDIIASAPEEKTRPWEQCVLPSRGLYYPSWGGIDSCEVRPFGISTDQALATQRLAMSGEALDKLFKDCCRFPVDGFDSLDLLAGDRTYLLFYLRGITHGENYEYMFECPRRDCQTASPHSYNLMDLVSTIKTADESLGEEPFRVVLPHLSESTKREVYVDIRFMRGRDINNIARTKRTVDQIFGGGTSKNMRKQRREPTVDETLSENLESVIVSINGVTDRLKIQTIVRKLHSGDTATIREWLREHSPGIDSITTVSCPDCGGSFKVPLPITESFFRSTPSR
jgi:hypothetical protein